MVLICDFLGSLFSTILSPRTQIIFKTETNFVSRVKNQCVGLNFASICMLYAQVLYRFSTSTHQYDVVVVVLVVLVLVVRSNY